MLHEAAKKGRGAMVELLLQYGAGAFVNTVGDGWLPLQLAARSGNVKVFATIGICVSYNALADKLRWHGADASLQSWPLARDRT